MPKIVLAARAIDAVGEFECACVLFSLFTADKNEEHLVDAQRFILYWTARVLPTFGAYIAWFLWCEREWILLHYVCILECELISTFTHFYQFHLNSGAFTRSTRAAPPRRSRVTFTGRQSRPRARVWRATQRAICACCTTRPLDTRCCARRTMRSSFWCGRSVRCSIVSDFVSNFASAALIGFGLSVAVSCALPCTVVLSAGFLHRFQGVRSGICLKNFAWLCAASAWYAHLALIVLSVLNSERGGTSIIGSCVVACPTKQSCRTARILRRLDSILYGCDDSVACDRVANGEHDSGCHFLAARIGRSRRGGQAP